MKFQSKWEGDCGSEDADGPKYHRAIAWSPEFSNVQRALSNEKEHRI